MPKIVQVTVAFDELARALALPAGVRVVGARCSQVDALTGVLTLYLDGTPTAYELAPGWEEPVIVALDDVRAGLSTAEIRARDHG